MTNPHIKATWLEVEVGPDFKGIQWVVCVETDLPLSTEHPKWDSGTMDDLISEVFETAPPGAKVRVMPAQRRRVSMPGIAGSESMTFEG